MVPLVWHRRRRTGPWILCAIVAGFTLVASTALRGQEQFQFYLLATDQSGNFVTDLTPADIAMSENGEAGQVVKVERFSLPVKLTVTIDNSSGATNVLGNFREGLEGFFAALPEDVETTMITTAPQPRTHVRPTTDRAQIMQGVNRIGLDSQSARFSDALAEYAERVARDNEPYIPVLLMLTSTATEVASVQPAALENGLKTLVGRGSHVYVFKTVSQQNNTTALERLDNGRQKIIGEMAAQATGGHYEGITVPARLQEVLPPLGEQLALMHRAHMSQYLVTMARPAGASGQPQNLDIRLTREGLNGSVSGDGRIR